MLWAPCVMVDIPVDLPAPLVPTYADALGSLVTALEATEILRVNMALSGAALQSLAREGFDPLIERVGALAEDGRVELLATAAHGALLPLLPTEEIHRQLELGDRIGRRFFGDNYHPACLWPPALAMSHRVAQVASERDYSSILVDEGAMRVWPARWCGNRIDWIEGLPGMFLLPSSRSASLAFDAGQIHLPSDLASHLPGGVNAEAYLISTILLRPASRPEGPLLAAANDVRTARLEQLFSLFPLSHATSPLPCADRSTAQELGCGLPFARWFSPDNANQALRWRIMAALAELLSELDEKGRSALPSVRALRESVDRGWREEPWRRSIAHGLGTLRRSVEGVRSMVQPSTFTQIMCWFDELSHSGQLGAESRA